jgi:hypothetical protein
MRIASLALPATCLLFCMSSYAQTDRCSTHVVGPKPSEKTLTSEEIVHRAMFVSTPEQRRMFYWGDVEFILRCGTQQDAADLFSAVRNEPVRMYGATVFEAGQNFIRVSWDDGFNSGGFKFNFDMPLRAIPKPGQKVSISGTYSSYSREPFQINLVNSSFLYLASQP